MSLESFQLHIYKTEKGYKYIYRLDTDVSNSLIQIPYYEVNPRGSKPIVILTYMDQQYYVFLLQQLNNRLLQIYETETRHKGRFPENFKILNISVIPYPGLDLYEPTIHIQEHHSKSIDLQWEIWTANNYTKLKPKENYVIVDNLYEVNNNLYYYINGELRTDRGGYLDTGIDWVIPLPPFYVHKNGSNLIILELKPVDTEIYQRRDFRVLKTPLDTTRYMIYQIINDDLVELTPRQYHKKIKSIQCIKVPACNLTKPQCIFFDTDDIYNDEFYDNVIKSFEFRSKPRLDLLFL